MKYVNDEKKVDKVIKDLLKNPKDDDFLIVIGFKEKPILSFKGNGFKALQLLGLTQEMFLNCHKNLLSKVKEHLASEIENDDELKELILNVEEFLLDDDTEVSEVN